MHAHAARVLHSVIRKSLTLVFVLVLDTTCLPCMKESETRPNRTVFLKFLEPFLSANPDIDCAAAGHAAYSSAVVVKDIKNKTYVKSNGFFNSMF